MKRRIFVVYLLIFVVAASMPAYGGKGSGGKGSVQPASWWSPALLSASTSTSSTGATSWKDCVEGGGPSTAPPAAGNCITFDFKTNYWDPTNGTGPWLQLQCFRAGEDYAYEGQLSGSLILADSRAGFPGGWGYGVPFVLNGTAWHVGPATCTIQVGHRSNSGKFVVDAGSRFSVSG